MNTYEIKPNYSSLKRTYGIDWKIVRKRYEGVENEKIKLNDRLLSLVDMKLDKIIDNDTYVKKEKNY